jgi:hypothetical protein
MRLIAWHRSGVKVIRRRRLADWPVGDVAEVDKQTAFFGRSWVTYPLNRFKRAKQAGL